MENQEKIELLEDAQDKLAEVIEILEEAVGDDSKVKAYLIDQLRIHLDNDHGFLSCDLNISEVISNLRSE